MPPRAPGTSQVQKDGAAFLANFPPPPELEARYVFQAILGMGAMGVVYRARDRELGRPVAVKVATPDLDAEHWERFAREAASLAALRHPHIVEIYDHGVLEHGPYLAMEFVDGFPLDHVPAGRTPLECLLPVAEALEVVHDAGLVHRDLKPANILWCPPDRPVLIDFGLLKDPAGTDLTATGVAVGTLGYMPPEVLAEGAVTPGADWYAWGVTLYVLAEQTLPFTIPQALAWGATGERPPLEFRVLDPEGPAARAIEACLVLEPERRPHSRAELEDAARRAPGSEATAARPLPPGGPPAPPPSSPAPDLQGSAARDATRALPRVATRAVAAEPPRLPRAPLAIAAALAGVMALMLAPRPATPPPRAPPAPAPPPPAGPPVLPDRVEAFVAEFQELPFLFLDPGGELRAMEPGAARPPGWAPLLDPDPAAWGTLIQNRPALARFYAWIGEGDRPGELPAEAASRLRSLDEAYASEGLPRPFFPYLYLRPRADPLSTAPLAADFASLFPDRAPPAEVTGWLATGLEALLRCREATRVVRDGAGITANLLTRHNESLEEPGLRRTFADHYRGASSHLHAGLVAFGRSLAEEPTTRIAATELFLALEPELRLGFRTYLATLPLAVLLGPAPEEPSAADLVRAGAARLQANAQRVFGLSGADTEARATEIFAWVARLPETPRHLAVHARIQLLLAWGRREDFPPEGPALVRELLADVEAHPAGTRIRIYRALAHVAAAPGSRAALAPLIPPGPTHISRLVAARDATSGEVRRDAEELLATWVSR